MKVHFIAIGGNAMHNIAIALHKKGFEVSGSDDEIFDPSRSRLKKYGLLPDSTGWYPEKITSETDAVILGMHARPENPELQRARELGLKIYSFPEYLYEQTFDKTRVVIGGSHGKTTITAMVMHVLKREGKVFDYMVGAVLQGFETMASLSQEAKIAIFEGDEYLSSPIDRRPKFHLYKPKIGVISGIAWDHINVFPTFENYCKQFEIFAELIPDEGTLIYFQDDLQVRQIAEKHQSRLRLLPYGQHKAAVRAGKTFLLTPAGEIPIQVFGQHNLENLSAAKAVCMALGVRENNFYDAIRTFGGAAKRLERLAENSSSIVFGDFAHAPSKLRASIEATQAQFPARRLVACVELHTFSSLNAGFLPHYRHSMDSASEAIVFFNPKTLAHKKLPPISETQIKEAFAASGLRVFTSSEALQTHLLAQEWQNTNLLLMSSGNFSGLNVRQLAEKLVF